MMITFKLVIIKRTSYFSKTLCHITIEMSVLISKELPVNNIVQDKDNSAFTKVIKAISIDEH